ncbi:hypothetical protein SKAU_G00271890 [Synaphobranchus kaupii]|uniref:Uncharacterized protein n=1 Tax=Synaphobranchus kaupii TaxID=118154 RepID=A0A9Q1IPR6_SYNKA|nr:hypothetical protein SKAU_G00271890 [Synaphobranchus kaupii]
MRMGDSASKIKHLAHHLWTSPAASSSNKDGPDVWPVKCSGWRLVQDRRRRFMQERRNGIAAYRRDDDETGARGGRLSVLRGAGIQNRPPLKRSSSPGTQRRGLPLPLKPR